MGRISRRRMAGTALSAAVVAAVGSSIARADTSWLNPVTGTWSDSSKWSSGLPGAGTTTIAGNTPDLDYWDVILRSSTSIGKLLMDTGVGELLVQGSNSTGHVTLTTGNGFTLSNGFLMLESADGAWDSDLNVSSGGLFIDFGGNVFLSKGSYGGNRIVTGSIYNRGYVYTDAGATYNSGTFTNAGQFIVDDFGAFLVNPDATFRNTTGGSVDASALGLFVVNGGTFDWAGGTLSGPIYLSGVNPTLKTSVTGLNNLSFGSTFHLRANGHIAGDFSAGALMMVEGNGGSGNVTLNMDGGATNKGRIEFQSIDGAWGSNLTITGGSLTNSGQLWITTGSNGARTITGELYNIGETLIASNADFNGKVHNSGTFLVNAGNVNVNNSTFIQDAGTLNISQGTGGYLLLNSSTFLFLGGQINGEVELRDNSYLVTSTVNGHGAKFLVSRQGNKLSGGLAPETTLRVMGNDSIGHVLLHIPNGGSNYGTINLESANSGWNSDLTVDANTLTNYGTIIISPGSGGYRNLSGTIDNELAVYDKSSPGYNTTISGDFYNNNLYYIGANTTTRVPTGSTFHQSGFQLSIEPGGKMSVEGGTFLYSGGSLTGAGAVELFGAHLRTTLANGAGSTFRVTGTSTLESNLSPNTNVNVIGNGKVGHVAMMVHDGVQMRGTVRLTAVDAAWQSSLYALDANGNTYTGAINNTGSIFLADDAGVGGPRVVKGYLTNKGYVEAITNGDFYGSVYNQPGGTFKIDDGRTVTLHFAGLTDIFSQEGGALILGKNSHLNMDGASFIFDSGTLTLGSSMIAKSASVPALSSVLASGAGTSFSVTDPAGISIPGGQIIGNDGASIVATGGGNIAVTQGGKIIGNDGASVVAQGGGNIAAIDLASLISNDGGSFKGAAIVASGAGNIILNGGSIVAVGAGNALPVSARLTSAAAAPTPNPGEILLDGSTMSMSNGIATALATAHVNNNSIVTGNGTFTASNFDVDATSTLEAAGGALHLLAPINAYSNGTLLRGHWRAGSGASLDTPGIGSITTNAADVTLEGATSTWTNIDSIQTNAGRFAITGGRNFTAAGSLSNSGTLVIGHGSTLKVSGLTNTGSIDLNGALVIDYSSGDPSPLAALRAQIGGAIGSSDAAADVHLRIGYAETSGFDSAALSALGVDNSAALLDLTFAGDSNLDGKVDLADLYALASAWKSTDSNWTHGDFTYDGKVDVSDLTLLAVNWQAGVNAPDGASSLTSTLASLGLPQVAVPEPAAMSILGISLMSLLPRRIRRSASE